MIGARGRSSASADRRARRRAILAVLLAGAALLVPASSPVRAVEEEDIASILGEYRRSLDEGQTHLGNLDFAEAIEAFSRLVEAYKTGRIPLVTSDARQIVAKAYEGRALAFANLGRNTEAQADFESLIRFDPSWSIDVKSISSKIVALYTGVRKTIVGVLSVEGDPHGAELALNDQPLGVTPVIDKEVIAGTYRLRIRRLGYDPFEEEIQIEPGSRTSRTYRLTPNARGILVATVPRDVKVLVDGKEKGATFGLAGPAYQEVATEMGLKLTDISEPLLIDALPPGHHEILLRKECYQEVLYQIDVAVDPADNAALKFKPFVLEPSRGEIAIASDPPGASVILDGRPAGETPLSLKDVCAGVHDVVLAKEGLGRWAGTVEARRRETVRLSQRLKLSVAAFDLRPGVAVGEDLGAGLRAVTRYNLLEAGRGLSAEVAERVRLEVESGQGKGLSERTLKDLFNSLDVEMIAVAVPVGAQREQVDLLLYGVLQPVPDRWRLETASLDRFRRFKSALEEPNAVEAAWSGVKAIDVAGERHPIVLAVTPGSPAERAGVAPGDLIVTAAGVPLVSVADFERVVRRAAPGEALPLALERAGAPREARLDLRSTPVLLPMRDRSRLYNKLLADLRQTAASAPDAVRRAHAWLNVGVALMHFGQWDAAVREAFRQADLADGAGISRGTVRYLTGLCYERLGMPREARAAYEEAASSREATLGSHDGPTLAQNARRRAAALTSNQK